MKKAITQEQPDKPCKAHAKNFETLRKAFAAGDVCLMETEIVATKERVAAICAVKRHENGDTEIIPFALMMNGNPYELLNPPKPEGGFVTQKEAWAEEQI
jgi:hypothetical protein